MCVAAGNLNSEEGRALVEKYHALFSAGLKQVSGPSLLEYVQQLHCKPWFV